MCLIAYDRCGHIVGYDDQAIPLDLDPDTYALFGDVGVQGHAELALPKGQFWLRTGIYDQGARKVGTMEFPLPSITATDTSSKWNGFLRRIPYNGNDMLEQRCLRNFASSRIVAYPSVTGELFLFAHRPELEADPLRGVAFFTYLSNQRSIS